MRTIIKVALRIVIILAFIQVLQFLINNVSYSLVSSRMIPYEDVPYPLAYSLIIFITPAAVAIAILVLLWRKTDWLVKVLAGNIDENALVINTSNSDFIKVVMRVLGIILIFISIPNLFGMIAYSASNSVFFSGLTIPPQMQSNEIERWVTVAVKLLVGLLLATGAIPPSANRRESIRKIVKKIWNAGTSEEADNKTE
ncbi:MAG: hypothetical protein FJ025_03210 [Chloroflexi bacterium]|nr:hypothetical protein [Chloroflexota bacterium]